MSLTGVQTPTLTQCYDAGGAAPRRSSSGGGSGQTTFVTNGPVDPSQGLTAAAFTGTSTQPDPATRAPKMGDVVIITDPATGAVTTFVFHGVDPDGVTAGAPGSFTTTDTTGILQIPRRLADLTALGDLGATTAWTSGQHVELGDGSHAHWDGSAWAAGDAPIPPPTPPTGATAGAPGSFTPAGSAPVADLAALQALGDLGQTTPWAVGEYVDLDDGSQAYWDGNDWAVGAAPQPPNVFPDTATAGTPGTWTNVGDPTATIDVPDDLPELQALGALGNTAAWATGEHNLLEDGTTKVYWDGTDWAAGEAPPPPPPPPDEEPDDGDDDDIWIVPDPSTMTIQEVKDWVNALPHNGHGHDATQEMISLERALDNRQELVDWLDQKLGVI